MIAYNRPKKIKGARKKARAALIERLKTLHPVWFENKTEKEIISVVNAFKVTGMKDEEFPAFCISYEAKTEQTLTEGA